MTRDLFDRRLRAIVRDRAAMMSSDRFLLDRAFDDCIARLMPIARDFDRALMIGCASPAWRDRVGEFAQRVDVVDPGPRFAAQAGGIRADEDAYDFGEAGYDLCIAIGTLDTVNDLPRALSAIRKSLRPDSPFFGALAGGNSLPALRASLIEAERSGGRIAMRTHPRIEAPSLSQLLTSTGFAMPVIDVDRVRVRYRSLSDLVADLRAMGSSSQLAERAPPLSKGAFRRAAEAFLALGDGHRTEETIEILHFLAWSP